MSYRIYLSKSHVLIKTDFLQKTSAVKSTKKDDRIYAHEAKGEGA